LGKKYIKSKYMWPTIIAFFWEGFLSMDIKRD